MQSTNPKRPLSESEDEDNSPDYLLPVKDPYPSDDENIRFQERLKCKELEKHFILRRVQNSSEMLAEHVQYFFYIDFLPRAKEVSLERTSVKDCLFHALKFASSFEVTCDNRKIENFKLHGKCTDEIYDCLIETIPSFKWILENDTYNLHDLTKQDYDDQMNFFIENAGNLKNTYHTKGYAESMVTLLKLFKELYGGKYSISIQKNENQLLDYSKIGSNSGEMSHGAPKENSNIYNEEFDQQITADVSEKSELVQNYLDVLAVFLGVLDYKRNGQCSGTLNFVVQNPDMNLDSKLIEDKYSSVIVKPSGVLLAPSSDSDVRLKGGKSWLLVVEVFDPLCDVALDKQSQHYNPCVSPVQKIFSVPSEVSYKGENESVHLGESPSIKQAITSPEHSSTNKVSVKEPQSKKTYMEKQNTIANLKYCEAIRNKIKASVPLQCSSPDCMDKIAGHHVLQLFTMADKSLFTCERKNVMYSSEKLEICCKSIGIFIVNEFVYFSKLLVNHHLLSYILRGDIVKMGLPELIKEGKQKPRVCYGNFRFDLTIANHRKAFLLFIIYLRQRDIL